MLVKNQISLVGIIASCLLIGGCNSMSTKTSNTSNTASSCGNKPTGFLDIKNVKNVQLSSQIITESGQVRTDKYLGYQFNAKSGDKLNYQTNDDVCIWVYAPNNEIITSKDLSSNGNYIIQVAARQGTTTFSLAMKLENEQMQPVVTSDVQKSKNIENTTSENTTSENTTSENTTSENTTSENTSKSDQTIADKKEKEIDRISPSKAIKTYYNNLNQANYENSWNMLSNNLQTNQQDHPNGYNSYLEWWKQVNYTDTKVLRTKNNGDKATVMIRCKYTLASGRKISSIVKYYLTWNSDDKNWKINSVERL